MRKLSIFFISFILSASILSCRSTSQSSSYQSLQETLSQIESLKATMVEVLTETKSLSSSSRKTVISYGENSIDSVVEIVKSSYLMETIGFDSNTVATMSSQDKSVALELSSSHNAQQSVEPNWLISNWLMLSVGLALLIGGWYFLNRFVKPLL